MHQHTKYVHRLTLFILLKIRSSTCINIFGNTVAQHVVMSKLKLRICYLCLQQFYFTTDYNIRDNFIFISFTKTK